MASNEVRIISGLWRGRKLRFPASPGLRPTLGRARETLFNWLQADIRDARCLDLYAGSGALGFEALSRGALAVTFVERDRRVSQALTANAERLATSAATVVNRSAEQFLRRATGPWDVVFFDPPFASGNTDAILAQVLALTGPEGLVYVERPLREPLPCPTRLHKQGKAGDCHFGLLSGG